MENKVEDLIRHINKTTPKKNINIMEVCGTHTMAISRAGLRQLLPPNINLISGPGCPVCVTAISDIDWILEIIKNYKVSIFTFGDMIKVPGSNSSLYQEKSIGRHINICYSPLDALEFAINNPDRKVIFIAIGFETTIPLTAVVIKRAYQEKVNNFYIYNIHKLIPPALDALLSDRDIEVDGFLLPGHVSTIIGSIPYKFIPENYNTPCVISGFEPIDILQSINMILNQIREKNPGVKIQYTRAVRKEGNKVAVDQIYDVFENADTIWRGLGQIPKSGLKLRSTYSKFDAKNTFKIKEPNSKNPKGCECGNILKGIKKPIDCRLFSKICSPASPVGPCMVSSEGACAAYYKYERLNLNRKDK